MWFLSFRLSVCICVPHVLLAWEHQWPYSRSQPRVLGGGAQRGAAAAGRPRPLGARLVPAPRWAVTWMCSGAAGAGTACEESGGLWARLLRRGGGWGATAALFTNSWQWPCGGGRCALLPGTQGQDVWGWLRAAPGKVQPRHEGTFPSQEGAHKLEQVSWRATVCPRIEETFGQWP